MSARSRAFWARVLRPRAATGVVRSACSSVTRRSTSSPPGVVIFRSSASWKTCCQAHRISSALWNRRGGVTVQRLAEEPDQSLPDTGVELLGVDHQFRVGHGRVGLAVSPLGQHARPERHLVERRRGRVPLRMEIPALGLAVDEERVGVAGRAHPDVVQRGTGQGEVEQNQLVSLLGQRADADVVRLDVPVDDPVPLQRGDRREQVVAVAGEHLQARHALGSQHGRERPVARLLQDEHGPAAR